MAIPTLSFVLGILALLYLSTFVFFAVLRVVTGVSIQRLGFSSIRHVAYTPRDGLKLEVRGLGFKIHRPTFAQPTWISLVITELKVTLDLALLASGSAPKSTFDSSTDDSSTPDLNADGIRKPTSSSSNARKPSAQTRLTRKWAKLTEIKNKIKRVHRIIPWLKLFDLVAERSSCVVIGVGTVHVGSVLLSVDTRRSTVDRSRLFQHTRTHSDDQKPAEWTLQTRSVLFTPDGDEAMEILDNAVLNIHGFLQKDVEGLRDASVSLKLGRLNVPYDVVLDSSALARGGFRKSARDQPSMPDSEKLELIPEQEPESPPVALPKSLAAANDFVSSTLRGIRQISIAIGFFGVSKRVDSVQPSGVPLYVNMSMQELGMDLYRLDPSTPAHSMYFSRSEVAHQALLSAISISLGIDDGHAHPDRLLYIPMTTATIRTTLPNKILQFSKQKEEFDLNSNIFFANLVVTSPSIDLDPQHLPLVLALLRSRPRSSSSSIKPKAHHFASQLLPKAVIKLSIHEPVVRVSLPPVETKRPGDFDFDLLISAISFVSLDIDASHTYTTEDHYSASFNFRIASHKLYYQTTSRQTHDLLVTDSIGLKAHVTAAPQLLVIASANLQTFSIFMIRPEISEGVRQIVHQLRTQVRTDKKLRSPKKSAQASSLRSVPKWLNHFDLEASDFNIEVAGVDEALSPAARGFTLHLDSWTAEYNVNKDDVPKKTTPRKRGVSQGSNTEDEIRPPLSPQPRLKQQPVASDSTDSRRLAIHVRGLEAFVVESSTQWESEPCLSVARGEVAFTTSNDGHGPVLHVNSHIKSIYLQYSLFRHYALGVAVLLLRNTLSRSPSSLPNQKQDAQVDHTADTQGPDRYSEFVMFDSKVGFLQVKAQMPEDPYMMFQMENMQVGRHRWTTPYARAQVMRLYAEHPTIPKAWSRVVSLKSPRVDVRDGRRKHGAGSTPERNFDIVVEALRIGIPHQLIVHKIFDNFVNTAKTATQLHHRFKTGSNEYILQKHPEGPKKVPKLSLRVHMVLFEIEEGAFEWKLGAIFRAGLVEQKQRLAREAAFDLKCQKIRSSAARKTSTRVRSNSPQVRDESNDPRERGYNRKESRASSRRPSRSKSRPRDRYMRYDREGMHEISSSTKTTIDDAWQKLQTYNAQSWRKRINRALNYQSGAIQDIRKLLWGSDVISDQVEQDETILQIPSRPALMSILMSDLTMTLDKPSFPIAELPDFMHRVGKGLPLDTTFALLIPLHAHFDVGELQIGLRDYPLPLLHIPAIKPGQSPRLPSWSLKTDFVIAEEYRTFESTRDLQIMVIPPEKMHSPKKSGGFAVDVRRTVSPVKTYSDMKVDINTARDTRITWGTSYQPAIQDLMQVIEGFTKPQVDPSERVGFWDKIRLSFHSRVSVSWNGGGDVYLMLKGSRDPYVVTGHGAGFVMIWRNNVRWNIWQENDPKKFMTVDSGDYVLAIPDFSHYARRSAEYVSEQARDSDRPGSDVVQTFKKVIMKLSGNVRWQAGLIFERNLPDGDRSFEFKHHYDVTLQNPVHIKQLKDDTTYDAFRGFRSNYIHMNIAVISPVDREWSVTNLKPASNYNAVHLTPRFFTHFFSWWGLFSGTMSLPIRQGPLFPNIEKSGKKFGRHIATIKYSVLLSPLFISHVYIHKDADEFNDDVLSATGLKFRLDSFMFDVHQRREEFESEVKGLNKKVRTTGMRINQALVDLISADMRAVSVRIAGTSLESVNRQTANQGQHHRAPSQVDVSNFTIPDNDYSWIDVDDFVEVDWTLPSDRNPKTWILPMAYAPRFTYRRQTDHANIISGDPNRHSSFGYEDTHHCIMSDLNDSRQIQMDLIKARIAKIDELIAEHNRNVGEHELQIVKEVGDKSGMQRELEELRELGESLQSKKSFLKTMYRDLRKRLPDNKDDNNGEHLNQEMDSGASQEPNDDRNAQAEDAHEAHEDSAGGNEEVGDFSNRFVVHNAQIKWNNALRNTILRYIHQVSQRRGFVYYTSRRAVKFILDIIEDQNKSKGRTDSTTSEAQDDDSPETPWSNDEELNLRDRVQQLVEDGKKFVDADDPDGANWNKKSKSVHDANEGISHDFVSQNTYHVRLVAPQIQLQSEKNPKSVVLVTTRSMRLRVFQIMDKDRIADEVSGLVQTRFSQDMDNMQFFVTTKQLLSPNYLALYSGNSYGTPAGSLWPPWAPIEAMFDFSVQAYGFSRVVQRTSASVRYDKYNKLRLKYNDSVSEGKNAAAQDPDSPESRMDQVWVDFPQMRAICDSAQYYAMYIIVLDLLMWSEPLEKTRNERLEKIMLASDFSDLRGAPEMVTMLQDRIRQLEEIKTHFHVNEKYLDRQGWEDRIHLEQDLANCEDELFFLMKAITTAQRKMDERVSGVQSGTQVNGVLRYFISASEIVWHLTKDANQPLAEFQLKNATFERKDNSDGSNYNAIEIDRIQGLSLLPNAMYPHIIMAYTELLGREPSERGLHMLRVNWYKLEAIAGINVVDHFEVNLHPLKVQLEYETGRRLFEYIFPGAGVGEEGFSPFMIKHSLPQPDEEDEDEENQTYHATKDHTTQVSSNQSPGSATGAGTLENRLQPTHALPDYRQSSKGKSHGLGISSGESHRWKLFNSSSTSLESNQKNPKSRSSFDNISLSRGRDITRSGSTAGTQDTEKKKRFSLQKRNRSASVDSRKSKESKTTTQKSDDLTQMLNRASNYMTLAYVKVPSVVLCLSYKGKGNRNFEDVHDLVFRMPTVEYRNKTWSNLDLALALKKDVMRALISHTGAILGNKFHHKPGKYQQSRLREIANSSVVLSSTEVSRAQSPAASAKDLLHAADNNSPLRYSEEAEDANGLDRTDSRASTRSEASDTPKIEVTSPGGGQYQKPEYITAEDAQSLGSSSTGIRRHFSAITNKRKGSEEPPHEEKGEAEAQLDETTPKRQQFVKKILQSLDRS